MIPPWEPTDSQERGKRERERTERGRKSPQARGNIDQRGQRARAGLPPNRARRPRDRSEPRTQEIWRERGVNRPRPATLPLIENEGKNQLERRTPLREERDQHPRSHRPRRWASNFSETLPARGKRDHPPSHHPSTASVIADSKFDPRDRPTRKNRGQSHGLGHRGEATSPLPCTTKLPTVFGPRTVDELGPACHRDQNRARRPRHARTRATRFTASKGRTTLGQPRCLSSREMKRPSRAPDSLSQGAVNPAHISTTRSRAASRSLVGNTHWGSNLPV